MKNGSGDVGSWGGGERWGEGESGEGRESLQLWPLLPTDLKKKNNNVM